MTPDDAPRPIDLAHEPAFDLGDLRVRPSTRELVTHAGREVIEPRVMQVLTALARQRGEVVSRDDLSGSCWGGRIVSEDAINRCISAIRRLAKTYGGFSIETVARVGYRLDAGATTAEPIALPGKPSIAVMPFANLSDDREQEYFADGMVVEIVEALSRCRSIFVIASGSSLSFKGKGVSVQDAARLLGVRYVLEGSVRKAAGRLRIGVELVDAADGAPMWTDRFEGGVGDVFELQDKVALAVAGRIEPTVEVAEIRRAATRPATNPDSYDLYLRALPRFRTFARTGMAEALDLLNRAIALDPDCGPALSLAAHCHRLMRANGWADDPRRARQAGLDLAQRALRVAGDDAVVVARAAFVLHELGSDREAAVALLDRAIALNPGSSLVWFISGVVRLATGDGDLAVAHLETSMRLDPMGPNREPQIATLAEARLRQGRVGEAAVLLREADPQMLSPYVAGLLAIVACLRQSRGEAHAALARYRAIASEPLDAFAAGRLDDQDLKLLRDAMARAEGVNPATP